MHRVKNSKMAVPPADGSGCSIDAMPDGILEHILGFLPAPEFVRTCVLARRWRHLWRFATGMRVGCGSDDDFLTPAKERREFMDHVLLGGESPLDTCGHAYPTMFFSDNETASAGEQGASSARNSFLDFSSCPSLENLVLRYCEFWSATMISSKSLKHLAIISCSITASASEHPRLRIYAPHMVSLHIDDIEGRTPVLDSMPSLVEAFVRIIDDCEDTCDKLLDNSQCGEYCTTSGNGGDDNHCVLLKGLSEAKDFELISSPELFIFKMDLRLCPTFSKLKTLFLNEYWYMPDDFTPLACILEHSPVLEELTLELFCERMFHFIAEF
ncbi:putative F-box protein At3g58860 isoform X2 [Miscanthus floridulus]|uniref:putative F-box protein At3g58860 isoform X2 n=1 Tax=Miscanthus floridulus TaxID=154761 RepID=UPI00345AB009